MDKEVINLDDIKVIRKENVEKNNKGVCHENLNLKISTWMKLYANLETSEHRAKMRDVSVSIAETFCKGKVAIKEHGTFASKFILSTPYHFFFSIVSEIEDTYNQTFTVTFHEIIDYTLGEIVDSIHFTDKVELSWIVTEYMLAAQNPKMTILCEKCEDPRIKYDIPFDVDIINIELPGKTNHHSKLSILKYSDNKIRIIIFTANMQNKDWKYYSQGLWVSPLLPYLPDNAHPSEGESSTKFKNDFTEYLRAYKQPEVFGWEALVQRADCSAINVVFIGSIPGSHGDLNLDKWGQKKLAYVLSNHVTMASNSENWPIIVQASSIGHCGCNYNSWLLPNIVLPMSRENNKKIIFLPDIKIIYPTENNSRKMILPSSLHDHLYHKRIHSRQQWLKNYFYQWKSDKIHQTFAMPNLKTYTRLSPDQTEISWFFLSSSNPCRSAFGVMDKTNKYLEIQNYEAGVIFIPKFIIKQNTFLINESNSSKIPVFLLPYDVPLIPYEPDDQPIC